MNMQLLDRPPYSQRDNRQLLRELNELSQFHLQACPEFSAMWPGWSEASTFNDLPYVHTTVFKHLLLRSVSAGEHGERVAASSSTTGQSPSQVLIDEVTAALQAKSSHAILEAFLGPEERPLIVLDSSRSLRSRGLSARVAAALALKPFSNTMQFVLDDPIDPASINWDGVRKALAQSQGETILYGFTWLLWLAWAQGTMPPDVRDRLVDERIRFVHSGGWKRLEAQRVSSSELEEALLGPCAEGSTILDYYGLVEQLGMIFPACTEGHRHVPVWATAIARDPMSAEALPAGQQGMLQLVNTIGRSGPFFSVLTEDVGTVNATECACGRAGLTFDLHARIPRAELRGCANV